MDGGADGRVGDGAAPDLAGLLGEIVECQSRLVACLQKARSRQPEDVAEMAALQHRVERLQAHLGDIPADPMGMAHYRFEELNVQRLNIVDEHGQVRLAATNQARSPDPVVRGQRGKRAGGNPAGLFFYNEHGDECGGLVYGADHDTAEARAGAALLFDRLRGDQVVGIVYDEHDRRWRAGLHVWERPPPRLPGPASGSQPQSQTDTDVTTSLRGAPRVMVGRTSEGDAAVILDDAQGRPRLRLAVSADGQAELKTYDEDGNVTAQWPD